jgi:hypothetical protein
MSPECESLTTTVVAALREKLGSNLYSCCVYGSAVRGNWIEGVSDLNLLIALNESTPAAHEGIAEVLRKHPLVDPFILGRPGMDRSVRAFAAKFSNIRRQYKVLQGADPLADVKFDRALERFLCEQAIRNLRLRWVYAFVTRSKNKPYERFLAAHVSTLFVQFSQVIRLNGGAPPKDFEGRISTFETEFKLDGSVMRELLALKRKPPALSDSEAVALHSRAFPVVDSVVKWIEANWPAEPRL